MAQTTPEVLIYDKLQKELLNKNGNYLYKIPFRDSLAVLKCYYGTRSFFRYAKKSFTNYLYSNKSSAMPLARQKIEIECLHIWKDAGFRVFNTYEDVVVEGLPPDSYMLFEYVEAQHFVKYFADKSIPVKERLDMWRRFLPVWHRRHALAIERREPKLIHENGDLKHVMIMEDGDFLFFDFEMVYRSPNLVHEVVAREILAYLRSLCKTVKSEWPLFMKETVEHYPDRKILESAYTLFFRHPNPMFRIMRFLDRTIKPGNWKKFSKYNTGRKLYKAMHE